MLRRPPRYTRTDTLFPYTTLFRSAAHAGKLLDLLLAAARAGMRHHVNGVYPLFTPVIQLLFGRNALHHRVGHAVTAACPGVHDLVVLFALGDQSILILLLEVLHQGFGFADHFLLLGRNDHVVLAKRDTRRTGVTEAKRHDRVGEQHCLLLAGVAIYGIDEDRKSTRLNSST